MENKNGEPGPVNPGTQLVSQPFAFDFTPRNLQEAKEMATMISNSDLAPKDFRGKPENVLVAIQMGHEIGLKPMQAIQNIAVINGRPTVWGDAALAVVLGSGQVEWWKERDAQEALKAGEGRFEVKRRDNPDPLTRTFTVEDAKRSGLWGKQGPWAQYTGRMLQLRARAFALRDGFADVLKGLAVREEVEDYPEPQRNITPPEAPELPKRLSEAKAEALPAPQKSGDELVEVQEVVSKQGNAFCLIRTKDGREFKTLDREAAKKAADFGRAGIPVGIAWGISPTSGELYAKTLSFRDPEPANAAA